MEVNWSVALLHSNPTITTNQGNNEDGDVDANEIYLYSLFADFYLRSFRIVNTVSA